MTLIFLLFVVFFAFGKNYYVSFDNGDDNSDGTDPKNPWKTFTEVERSMEELTNAAKNEDVFVYFDSGSIWSDNTFMIRCLGNANHWITFDGSFWNFNGNTQGDLKAQLRILNSRSMGSLIIIDQSSATSFVDAYIKIKGFELNGGGYASYAVILTENVNYIEIRNNEIHSGQLDKWCVGIRFHSIDIDSGDIGHFKAISNHIYSFGAHGIAAYPSNSIGTEYMEFHNNKIHTFGRDPANDYGAGIQIMSGRYSSITHNLIYDGADIDGFGIKLEKRKHNNKDVVITMNEIYDTHTGIDNCGGENIDVYNNYIRQCVQYCIRWGQSDFGNILGNVYDNTLSNCGTLSHSKDIFVSSHSTIDKLENNENGATYPFPPYEDEDDWDDGTNGSSLVPIVIGVSISFGVLSLIILTGALAGIVIVTLILKKSKK